MANLTPKHKTRGLDFAEQLAELAATVAPDTVAKSKVYATVQQLRELYGFTDDEKRQIVRQYLELGCSSINDLVRETKMHKPTIQDIVNEMESAGMVTITSMRRGEKGGRPTKYIRLVAVKSP